MYRNILLLKLESLNLIDSLTNMCWSCPCTTVFNKMLGLCPYDPLPNPWHNKTRVFQVTPQIIDHLVNTICLLQNTYGNIIWLERFSATFFLPIQANVIFMEKTNWPLPVVYIFSLDYQNLLLNYVLLFHTMCGQKLDLKVAN
jgi:hypothetical protein